MTKLKIISLNVNGLNNQIKCKKILLQLKQAKGDVLFLQETHLKKTEHEKLGKMTQGLIYSSSYGSKRRGVAIIIQPYIAFEEENYIADKEGRFILVVGKIDSITISLLNVYYPPEMGPEFMSEIIELLTTKCKGVIIMGGDLNLTLNPRLDSSNNKPHRADKASSILRGAISELGLVDIWRMLNSTKKEFTYYSGRFSTYNRLDYFFIKGKNS
uniref:exodeoxyribonuclease III n=1 Tax=Myripristis murdjan TaxID=586833 RepID=A0A667Z4X2_9TELE